MWPFRREPTHVRLEPRDFDRIRKALAEFGRAGQEALVEIRPAGRPVGRSPEGEGR